MISLGLSKLSRKMASSSLISQTAYSFRPFREIVDNQILANCSKFNQEVYLSQKQIDFLESKIYSAHNSQNLIFLFRLLKLFSLSNDTIDVFVGSQKRKYQDYHVLRMESESNEFPQAQQKLKMTKEQENQIEAAEDEEDQKRRRKGRETDNDQGKGQNSSGGAGVYINIFRMRNELKDVIWTLKNMHNNHIENYFLHHIFINKVLNKLIQMALDREGTSPMDYYLVQQAIQNLDRKLVTQEQLSVLLLLCSTNERMLNIPMEYFFDREDIELILAPLKNKPVSYALARFIISAGYSEGNQEEEQLAGKSSGNWEVISDNSVVLDSLSLQLFLFDLRQQINRKSKDKRINGIDVSFFLKFNSQNIQEKISLEEIRQLLETVANYKTKQGDETTLEEDRSRVMSMVLSELIVDAQNQANNFKIYNDQLLKQLELITQFCDYEKSNAGALKQLITTITGGIISASSSKTFITPVFSKYIYDYLEIAQKYMADQSYSLIDVFFGRQSIDKIDYQHLLGVYQSMAQQSIDSEEYLDISSRVFASNKHAIIQQGQDKLIISLAVQLHDTKTGRIFGVVIPPKQAAKRLPPSDVDFLSDFSESEGEESEAGEHSEKKKKKAIA